MMTVEDLWPYVQRCPHAVPCATCCWEWQGQRSPGGYGLYRNLAAHRLLRELRDGAPFFFEERPYAPLQRRRNSPFVVMHRCDNPPCCNPAHLVVGSSSDNSRDAMAKGRRTNGIRL
jgi:hypothetical protein